MWCDRGSNREDFIARVFFFFATSCRWDEIGQEIAPTVKTININALFHGILEIPRILAILIQCMKPEAEGAYDLNSNCQYDTTIAEWINKRPFWYGKLNEI